MAQVGFLGNPSAIVSPEQHANGAPLNGHVYQFVATTDGDIVGVFDVRVTDAIGNPHPNLYQHPIGTNTGPLDPAFFPVFPALAVDTWVDTPGITSRLGADLPGDGTTTFFDVDNNGPQTSFMFAQLTLPSFEAFVFRGTLAIESTTNPGTVYREEFFFSNLIPEPTTQVLASLSLITAIALRRRHC
jgi:hypothetical protein